MNSPGNEIVSVPPGLLSRVQTAAEEEQRSPDELVRDALERYLEDREWKKIYAYGEERARALGLSEEDLERLIAEDRAERRNDR
jgi:metal-responsive CopG/Arc/MetJ family transcriptional regulator